MNSSLSLPPDDDLDTQMLKVARDIAMDIYPIATILQNNSIGSGDFNSWKDHPRFLEYLRSETEAWKSATNTAERTKLKAAVVMEDFMQEAYTQLHDKKVALNHKVELGKLVAKIAGLGEPKVLNGGTGGATFQLRINIGPERRNQVTVAPTLGKIINHDEPEPEVIDVNIPEDTPSEITFSVPVSAPSSFGDIDGDDEDDEDEDYNPFVSPSTLDD